MGLDVRDVLISAFSGSVEQLGVRLDRRFYDMASMYFNIDAMQQFVNEDLHGFAGTRLDERESFHVQKLSALARHFAQIFMKKSIFYGLSGYSSYGFLLAESQAELKSQNLCDMYPCSG